MSNERNSEKSRINDNSKSKTSNTTSLLNMSEPYKNIDSNYFISENNSFYINLKESSQLNSPDILYNPNNLNYFLPQSLNSTKDKKDIDYLKSTIFKNVEKESLNDIIEYLKPYSQALKDISLKEVIESNSFKDAQIQTTGVIESRIQNLAITVDKVIHVMKINKDDKPPLIKLNTKEIIINLWIHSSSLRWSLINNISMLIENLYKRGQNNNLEELQFVKDILQNNHTDIDEYENLFYKKSENLYSLIKIVNQFINENIKNKEKEDYYLKNKENLDQHFLMLLDNKNSFNNKYSFNFKNFNIKRINDFNNKFKDNEHLLENNFYWVNTKIKKEKEKEIKKISKSKISKEEKETQDKRNGKEDKKAEFKSEKIFDIGKNNDKYKSLKHDHFSFINKNLDSIKNKKEIFINKSNISNENNKAKIKNYYIKKSEQYFSSDKKFLDILIKMDLNEANSLLKNIKNTFKFISFVFKVCHYKEEDISNGVGPRLVFYQGLSDMLFLHSCTQIYFKHNEAYDKQVNSCEIFIRDRDVNVYENEDENKNYDEKIHTGVKKYDKMYIWGQLVGWFKQTVDKPNASLSAERRGSLVYPELDSFFFQKRLNKPSKSPNDEVEAKFTDFEKVFEYPFKTRDKFFNKLIENPTVMWPLGNEWSFKNNRRIYGSIQFDSVMRSGIINPNEISERELIALSIKHILLADSIFLNKD